MSNDKSQKSKPICQMSREIPKDLVISQTLLYSNQLVQIRLAHRLYTAFTRQATIFLSDGDRVKMPSPICRKQKT